MTAQDEKKFKKFSSILIFVMFAVTILLFWLGINLLKIEVYPEYFDAERHVIISQNPDTKEIYAWKDAGGMVYTPDDAQVKNFAWGTTALILILMILYAGTYNILIKYYTKVFLEKSKPGHHYATGIQ